jgi:hypothetical protein
LGLGIAALVANVVGLFISGDDDSNGWLWRPSWWVSWMGAGGRRDEP